MAKVNIRVVGKQRQAIDVALFAQALLNLIENLNGADQQKPTTAAHRVSRRDSSRQPKGTAA